MGQLDSNFSFTGRLGNITAYRMKGSDKIILRTRGGARKDKIKRNPKMVRSRENYMEFGGRATATKFIRAAMHPLTSLADGRFTGKLNALLRSLQLMDENNQRGERGIRLTQNPKLLEGVQLNEQYAFDSIIRSPLNIEADKEGLSARIMIPALKPGVNFFVPAHAPTYFQVIAVWGVVPDLEYFKQGYQPVILNSFSVNQQTDWLPVAAGCPEKLLELSFDPKYLKEPSTYSMILTVGVMFGNIEADGKPGAVKGVGAAKVVSAV